MKYIKPEIVVLELEKDDVIVTSLGDENSTVNGNGTEYDGGNGGQKW